MKEELDYTVFFCNLCELDFFHPIHKFIILIIHKSIAARLSGTLH